MEIAGDLFYRQKMSAPTAELAMSRAQPGNVGRCRREFRPITR